MLMSNYIEELFELKGAILENIKSHFMSSTSTFDIEPKN